MRSQQREFVKRLRERMATERLNRTELAALLGRSLSSVSMVLSGDRDPTEDFAMAVVRLWPEFADYYAADLRSRAASLSTPI